MVADYATRDRVRHEIEADALAGAPGPAEVFGRLSEAMTANERDALARRSYTEAAAFRNRADAYVHAAAIVERTSHAQLASVLTAHWRDAEWDANLGRTAPERREADIRRALLERVAADLHVELGDDPR